MQEMSKLNQLGRVILGGVLLLLAAKLTIWNEQKAILSDKTSARPEYHVATLTPNTVDPSYNGRLVYVTGKVVSDEVLHDPLLLIDKPALVLQRDVEMYQWDEVGSEKVERNWFSANKKFQQVDYEQVWSDKPINSANFEFAAGQTYENPSSFPIPAVTFTASAAKLGQFTVDGALLRLIDDRKTLDLSSVNLDQLQRNISSPLHFKHDGVRLFLGDNTEVPAIGNMRIQVNYVEPQVLSILAMQQDQRLVPYADASGRHIAAVKVGKVSLSALTNADTLRTRTANVLSRVLIFVLWMLGLVLVLQGLSASADKWPVLANLHTNKAVLMSGLLALWINGLLINLQWFSYQPFWALIGFGVLAALTYIIYRFR